MAQEPHLSHFFLKIDGKEAPKEIMDEMLDCTIENSLHLPDMCMLRLHDAEFHWLDDQTFCEGTKLEVLGAEERQSLKTLFHGEVTALEMDLAAHGTPTLVVRCFDRSHRLHRGRHSRSFVQMTDTDIVKKIGQELQFNVHADSSSQVHDWVLQNNETNWEFLTERAERNGFRLYVQGENDLHFRKVKKEQDPPIELEWGKNLRSFRPRVTTAEQVEEVVVRGWDPKTKQGIIGSCKNASGLPESAERAPGSEVAKKAFGAAKMVVVDRPVHSQGEADDLARSLCDEIGGHFLEAEGLCYGQPNLRAGSLIAIKNIGRRFSGKYHVTSTTHTYTPAEGYATLFSVSGKRPSTLLSLLEQKTGKSGGLGGNIVVGVVTDNKDPDDLGRVKVKYPWLTEDHTSFWARQAAPMAGSGRGFYFLPEVDDEVLVAFEHGEISRPYIIGMLWNGRDKPVEGNSAAVKGGKVERRMIKTRIGHTVLLDDTDGKGEMSLTTKDGRVVILDDKNGQITMTDKAGNKITVKTSDNSIAMECKGNFTLDAKGKVSIQGTQGVEVKTPATMNLESSGPATVKSSAVLTVQGSLVKIN